MTAAEFARRIELYEDSLAPEIKKAKGIFYTDLVLADKILAEAGVGSDDVVLDPCCGTGSFSFAALRRGVRCVYGVDIDRSAIDFCVSSFPQGRFITGDSIEKSGGHTLSRLGLRSKVDYVVGNPPYARWTPSASVNREFSTKVAKSGNNMFVAALMRGLEMVRDGGTLCYIVPKNFLHVASYSSLRAELLRRVTIVSVIDLGACFRNVRGEQVVLTLRNRRQEADGCFAVKRLMDGEFVMQARVRQDEFYDEIILLTGETDRRIYSRLRGYDTLGSICSGYVGRGRQRTVGAIAGKDIRKFGFKRQAVPSTGSQIFIQNIYSAEAGIIAAFGGDMAAGETVTVIVADSQWQCRLLLGLLHSKICNFFLYRYCYNYSKLTMHTDGKYLKKLPVPTFSEELTGVVVECVEALESEPYMSDRWFEMHRLLDSAMYDAYGLSEDERRFVESEMALIHSPKWHSHTSH